MYKNQLKYLSLVTCATLIITGCGGGGGSSTTTSTTSYTGQVIDSYISNVSFSCGNINGITDENGSFTCNELPVTFKIGNILLGTISSIPTDGHIFPHDLLSIERTNLTDSNLIKMAQFLQTIDSNDNPNDGITVDDVTISSLESEDSYLTFDGTEISKTLVTEETAIAHLQDSLDFVESVSSTELPVNIAEVVYTPNSVLDTETIHTLEYMGAEETLAYDLYNKFYELYGTKQFTNIATNSETNHIKSVQALIRKYEITGNDLYDKEIDELTPGVYGVTEVQNLYDVLLAKGVQTQQDALEVGCMVEVTDVDDLDKYILTAQNSEADDIVSVYEYLRAGSYNHYWAFDKGLKNLGITEGCCSLGDSYCKTLEEYPQSNQNNN